MLLLMLEVECCCDGGFAQLEGLDKLNSTVIYGVGLDWDAGELTAVWFVGSMGEI